MFHDETYEKLKKKNIKEEKRKTRTRSQEQRRSTKVSAIEHVNEGANCRTGRQRLKNNLRFMSIKEKFGEEN